MKKRAQLAEAVSSSCGVNLFSPLSSASSRLAIWVAMPTWQVSSWQPRQIVQPSATIASVPKPTRLAPRQCSFTMSWAWRRPPSAQISTRLRMPASISATCTARVPMSAGSPTWRRACARAAPVPPSYPLSVIMSAPALAIPTAIVPMFGTTGTLTDTRASGLAVLSSSISWARSSIEYRSWLLEGEMRSAGPEALRARATASVTFLAGRWPPSPGLAP